MKRHSYAGWYTLAVMSCALSAHSQSTLPQTVAGPEEQVTPVYLDRWKECRLDLRERHDTDETTANCHKLSNLADMLPVTSHFGARAAAYVLYAMALTNAEQYEEALRSADRGITLVAQHPGSETAVSDAYFARGRARALNGDLSGSNADLEVSEAAARKAITGSADLLQRADIAANLKRILQLHAQVLEGLHQSAEAEKKSAESDKL